MSDDLLRESTSSTGHSSRLHYCPDCKKPLIRREGKKGVFWGCSGFPDCKTTLHDHNGNPSRQVDERYRCPICTRQLIKASNAKGDYWYCTGYNKGCKVTLSDEHGLPAPGYKCKSCGQLLKKRMGKNGLFWGCSAYPRCKQTYQDTAGIPKFERSDLSNVQD